MKDRQHLSLSLAPIFGLTQKPAKKVKAGETFA
jgi:hypothetical protein